MIYDNNINKNSNIDTTKQIQILTSDTNISKNNSMTLITSLNIVIYINMDTNIGQEH